MLSTYVMYLVGVSCADTASATTNSQKLVYEVHRRTTECETFGLVGYSYKSSYSDRNLNTTGKKAKSSLSTVANDYMYRFTRIWVQAVRGPDSVCRTRIFHPWSALASL